MSRALVQTFGSRPAFVGGVCVSVHDAWFLAEVSRFKRQISASHQHGTPDRVLLGRYAAFRQQERKYYAALGLPTPLGDQLKDAPRTGTRKLLGTWGQGVNGQHAERRRAEAIHEPSRW